MATTLFFQMDSGRPQAIIRPTIRRSRSASPTTSLTGQTTPTYTRSRSRSPIQSRPSSPGSEHEFNAFFTENLDYLMFKNASRIMELIWIKRRHDQEFKESAKPHFLQLCNVFQIFPE